MLADLCQDQCQLVPSQCQQIRSMSETNLRKLDLFDCRRRGWFLSAALSCSDSSLTLTFRPLLEAQRVVNCCLMHSSSLSSVLDPCEVAFCYHGFFLRLGRLPAHQVSQRFQPCNVSMRLPHMRMPVRIGSWADATMEEHPVLAGPLWIDD